MTPPPDRYVVCPVCGMRWWHVQPSDHIVCPECQTDLTLVVQMEDEAAAAGGDS